MLMEISRHNARKQELLVLFLVTLSNEIEWFISGSLMNIEFYLYFALIKRAQFLCFVTFSLLNNSPPLVE